MKRIINAKSGAFAWSQAAVMIFGLCITFSLGIVGGVETIGQFASLFIIQQFATGILQQGMGDAGLYLSARSGEIAARRESIHNVLFLSLSGALATAIVGAVLVLAVAVTDLVVLLLLCCTIVASMFSEIARLVLIWNGSFFKSWVSCVFQVMLGLAAVYIAYLSGSIATLSVVLGGGSLVGLTIVAIFVRHSPRPVRIRMWLVENGRNIKNASMDSFWGSLGIVVAQQLTVISAGPEVLGEIRVAFQVLSPLVFVGIVVRRNIVSSSGATADSTRLSSVVGIPVIGTSIAFCVWWISGFWAVLAFIPNLIILLSAALERSLFAFQHVESGRLLKRGRSNEMVRIRRTGAFITIITLPIAAYLWGAIAFFLMLAIVVFGRLVAYRRVA